jgi:hypothetical protein
MDRAAGLIQQQRRPYRNEPCRHPSVEVVVVRQCDINDGTPMQLPYELARELGPLVNPTSRACRVD